VDKAIAILVLGIACIAPAHAGPRAECADSGTTMACLDARLKEANQRLNVTLKAAQERLEQLQAKGGRPMMGAFVDSQRKFNAYRDAQCSWQGVRAAPGENTAEYVRECQLVETLAREEALAAFARGGAEEVSISITPSEPADTVAVAPPQAVVPDAPAPVTVDPVPVQPAPPAAPQAGASSRGVEWRLSTWVVGGQQKPVLQDSTISISFDPSGKVAGNASVNRFSGTYRFDAEGRLVWPASFATTRMAASPALMAQERAFLESLRRTSRYRVDGSELILESANSSVVLAFSR
jgi:heat shock protein HslJ